MDGIASVLYLTFARESIKDILSFQMSPRANYACLCTTD
jgi:hypothetical protein